MRVSGFHTHANHCQRSRNSTRLNQRVSVVSWCQRWNKRRT